MKAISLTRVVGVLTELKFLLSLFDIKPDTSRGQHFLVSEAVLRREVEVAELTSEDVVLDIGAGFGFLTEAVARRAKLVYAVEVDERLAKVLEWRLSHMIRQGKIKLVITDFLKYQIPHDVSKVVSNPPYHIISPIIVKVLRELFTRENFKLAVMIVQKEYAERLLARPGDRRWSRIGACLRYFGDGEIICEVPRRCFWPPPEVDSALVKLWPVRREHLVDFATYERTTAILFTAARRLLRKVLSQWLKHTDADKSAVLADIREQGVDLDKRVRFLTPEEIEKIALVLREHGLV